MKATGIIRKIDDLGRVVIPKELRRTLNIQNNDLIEIFTDSGGKIIFQKYEIFSGLTDNINSFSDSLYTAIQSDLIVCDLDTVIATRGESVSMLHQNILHPSVRDITNKGNTQILLGADMIPIVISAGIHNSYKAQILCPITKDQISYGIIVAYLKNSDIAFLTETQKIMQIVAEIMSKSL